MRYVASDPAESIGHCWFRAMGCACEIIVAAGPRLGDDLARLGRSRLDFLERRWSRFIPTSDISHLNAAAGSPITVDRSTVTLVRMMGAGSLATEGAYDPTLLGSIVGLESGLCPNPATIGPGGAAIGRERGRWYDDVAVDLEAGIVRLPESMRLDPGGIGKGLAADLVAVELIGAGASGALVNVGGDLRVAGCSPSGDRWRIGIGRPCGAGELDQLALDDCGVATSGTLRRRWTKSDGRTASHLIDPATRLPVQPRPGVVETIQATVVAVTAAWAEVTVKALMVKGVGAELPRLGRLGVPACAVDADGAVAENEPWHRISTGSAPSERRAAS